MKSKIREKTHKAYKSLQQATRYLAERKEYRFECEKRIVTGTAPKPLCIHVSMYPMDAFASNLHVLFPSYLVEEGQLPILSFSYEHFVAMVLHSRLCRKSIWKYWHKRQMDIQKYGSVNFDNNELDLYYELVNEDSGSMLGQIKKSGMLESSPSLSGIFSIFRDAQGREFRPAQQVLQLLDEHMLEYVFDNGKRTFGIDKRFIRYTMYFLGVKE